MLRGLRGAYRRERVGVGLVLVGASLAACNLIAGINEGVLVDAGSDAGGTMKRDAARDGGRRDAGSDASDATAHDGSTEASKGDGAKGGDAAEAGVQQYNCAVMGGSHTIALGSLSGPLNSSPQLFLANTGMNHATQFRFVVPDIANNQPFDDVYTFSQSGEASNTPLPGGGPLTVVRYATGIAALIVQQDPVTPNAHMLAVTTLDDSPIAPATMAAWTNPVVVGDDTVLAPCANFDYRGALVVNDAAAPDYSVVVTCATEASVLVQALHYTGGVTTPVPWPAPPSGVSGGAPLGPHLAGITAADGSLYVMTTPASASGDVPPVGSGPSVYAAPAALDAAAPPPTTLKPNQATDFLLGGTLGTTLANEVGVMVLEADLGSVTGNAVIYAGTVPGAKLSTLTTTALLTATPIAGLANLPFVNNGGAHWQSFPSPPSDNLIAVGAEFPNNNGLNFMWWNGKGQLVAKQVGTGAFFYSDPDGGHGLSIAGGDVMLSGPFFAAAPSFVVAYVVAGTASVPAQAFADTVVCTASQ